MIPLHNREYEVRKDYSLVIHSLQLENLGIYTCQAYNGIGKAASWSVTVQAKGPYHTEDPAQQRYLKYIVNPPEVPTTLLPYYPPYPWGVVTPWEPPVVEVTQHPGFPPPPQPGPEYWIGNAWGCGSVL